MFAIDLVRCLVSILSLKSVGDIALSGLPRFQEVSLLKINYTLFPFAVCLLKLHLNHTAIFTPDPAHLRNWTFMGVFGVVASFFLNTGHISHPAKCASACVNKMSAMSSSVRGFKSVHCLVARKTYAKTSNK
jgi:hypothetical protein